MFHLLESRTSIDIFRTEKCKVTFGLKYIRQNYFNFISAWSAKYEFEK